MPWRSRSSLYPGFELLNFICFIIGENKLAYRYRVSASILVLFLFLSACAPAASIPPPATNLPAAAPAANAPTELTELKIYVETQAEKLHASITQLASASDRYFELARNASFDYTALWATQSAEVLKALSEARAAFLAANPQYEQMEGVVAGVPSLSQYDIILDAGPLAQSGSEDAVPFDLTLPNGKVLPKPGNLFEVTEATLWGTDPAYRIDGIHPDFNGNDQWTWEMRFPTRMCSREQSIPSLNTPAT